MRLTDLKNGEYVLIDANVILYAIQQKSAQCYRFLQQCVEENVRGVLPTHILAEVMHTLMIAEAKDNGWISGPNPARKLGEQPHRVSALMRYEKMIRDLLNLGLVLESLQREDFLTAMNVQRQSGLLTNDSLLAAIGLRLRINSIATADRAFERVQGMMIYSPDDVSQE